MRVPKPWGFVSVVSRGPLGSQIAPMSMDLFNEGKACISCIDGQTSRNSAKIFWALVAVAFSHCFPPFSAAPQGFPDGWKSPDACQENLLAQCSGRKGRRMKEMRQRFC